MEVFQSEKPQVTPVHETTLFVIESARKGKFPPDSHVAGIRNGKNQISPSLQFAEEFREGVPRVDEMLDNISADDGIDLRNVGQVERFDIRSVDSRVPRCSFLSGRR